MHDLLILPVAPTLMATCALSNCVQQYQQWKQVSIFMVDAQRSMFEKSNLDFEVLPASSSRCYSFTHEHVTPPVCHPLLHAPWVGSNAARAPSLIPYNNPVIDLRCHCLLTGAGNGPTGGVP